MRRENGQLKLYTVKQYAVVVLGWFSLKQQLGVNVIVAES